MGQGDDLNDLWAFNEKSGWSVIEVKSAVRPSPRSYHAGTSTAKHLFVFGGCSGHDRINDLWRFDLKTSMWEQLHAGGDGSDHPSVRGGAMLFAPSEEEIYVICGFAGKELGDAWRFNVETRTWHQIPTGGMPARSVAACANLDGKAIIFGGERDPSADGHKGAGHMRDDVYVFDPKNATWTAVECDGAKPCARGWMDWAPIGNDSLLLIGGLSEENNRLSDMYVFQLLPQ
jgi:N-acetylneuraminic acid mutarotase